MAAFTVVSTTIDGAPGYLISNSNSAGGNLTELQTALASLGATWSSARELTITGGGTNRIYAINGLKEQRPGIWRLNAGNGAHLCFAYNNASANDDVVLGVAPDVNGVSTCQVHITQQAPYWGGVTDVFNAQRGKCPIGLGSYTHHAGSIVYTNSAGDAPFDVWKASSGQGNIYFDDVAVSYVRNHFLTRPGITTTSKTFFISTSNGRIEAEFNVLTVNPMKLANSDNSHGLIWLYAAANSVQRVLRPDYKFIGTYAGISSCRQDVIDPASTYMDRVSYAATGSVRILRTLNTSFKDQTTQGSTPTVKAVYLVGGAANTVSFAGSTGIELRQSEAPPASIFTSSGSGGWVDHASNPYQFWLMAYGHVSIARAVDVKNEHQGNAGIPWAVTSSKSSACLAAYGSVVTAPFSFSTAGAGTLTISANATVQQSVDFLFKHAFDNADLAYWRGLSHTPASVDGGVFNFGSINLVVANGVTLTGSLKTAGTITNNGVITGSVEDANGVRVTVRKFGGGDFNIAARHGTTGSYTDLGFQSGVSSVTYTVPKGSPVEVVMWSLGYVTYSRAISTSSGGVVLDAEMTANTSINAALDVSGYLSNIALSLDTGGATPYFVITFNAAMTVSGIELGKALVHRLVGQEIALRSGFPPGSTSTIVINSDEITNQLPAVRLAIGASLLATDRVYLDFFINQAAALAMTPSYEINPQRADGNQVQILRSKPTLDSSILASEVRKSLTTELGRIDVATSTRLASIEYTAPANVYIAAIKGKTDVLVNGPTLTEIEASTVLAKQSTLTALATTNQAEHDATQATIAALPTPATASAIAAQVESAILADGDGRAVLQAIADKIGNTNLSAAAVASAVRTELATELGKLDATVSSRLATTGYTAPDNAKIEVIATKADELHKIHGLNPAAPLNVSPTSRTAGAINQRLTGDGTTSTTVTRL